MTAREQKKTLKRERPTRTTKVENNTEQRAEKNIENFLLNLPDISVNILNG